MTRCAFLTMDSMKGYVNDDNLAIEALLRMGWDASTVSWRNTTINWDNYDVVIIRSTWDYQQDPAAFLRTLEKIDRSSAFLQNGLNTVKWNLSKHYLRDLESDGVRIVPTIWGDRLTHSGWNAIERSFKDRPFVIKPVVSANAQDTFRIDRRSPASLREEVLNIFHDQAYMFSPL